jgi:hypothetical protein
MASNTWRTIVLYCGNHAFDVYDTVPPIPLQTLPRAHPPQLRCHQHPAEREIEDIKLPQGWERTTKDIWASGQTKEMSNVRE